MPYPTLQAQETTTFILVRHAEKIDDGTKDPALTEEGEQRATNLAQHLRATEITAIYSTSYQRTLDTVQPIARQKQLEIIRHDPFEENALQQIMKQHRGGIILISGHSNTTPQLVNRLLGEEKISQLDESQYDNLYIVTVTDIGSGQVVHLKY
jgi:broad specificity phosphatase PhoE